jgi:hypothetical protein
MVSAARLVQDLVVLKWWRRLMGVPESFRLMNTAVRARGGVPHAYVADDISMGSLVAMYRGQLARPRFQVLMSTLRPGRCHGDPPPSAVEQVGAEIRALEEQEYAHQESRPQRIPAPGLGDDQEVGHEVMVMVAVTRCVGPGSPRTAGRPGPGQQPIFMAWLTMGM